METKTQREVTFTEDEVVDALKDIIERKNGDVIVGEFDVNFMTESSPNHLPGPPKFKGVQLTYEIDS